jgi:hypothetical protein
MRYGKTNEAKNETNEKDCPGYNAECFWSALFLSERERERERESE